MTPDTWARLGPSSSGGGDLGVLDLIANRLRHGRNDDGAVLAIVVEGGGMRGIISAAMSAALETFGVTQVVDLIVGTSAGAANAAAMAAGKASTLATAYQEIFCAPGYFNARRALQGQPVLDGARIIREVDALLDLDAHLLDEQRPHTAFVATDVDDARAVALTNFATRQDAALCMQASAHLPLIGGPPLHHRSRRWVDGGIAESIPIASAMGLGATHALILATKPLGTPSTIGWTDRAIAAYLSRLNPSLGLLYRSRDKRIRHTIQSILSGTVGQTRTYMLAPRPGDVIPGRTQRDAEFTRLAHESAVATLRIALRETPLDAWVDRD
jgi:predicted patatin/cPLA2 family phospholipase